MVSLNVYLLYSIAYLLFSLLFCLFLAYSRVFYSRTLFPSFFSFSVSFVSFRLYAAHFLLFLIPNLTSCFCIFVFLFFILFVFILFYLLNFLFSLALAVSAMLVECNVCFVQFRMLHWPLFWALEVPWMFLWRWSAATSRHCCSSRHCDA